MDETQQFPPRNPALEGASTLFQSGPGMLIPRSFNGVVAESAAYRTGAWIGIPLMGSSPVIDVVGPDACAFLQSICVNDFTNLKYTGLRHAFICDEQGRISTDGVVIRLEENRYRTYWLNPPIEYLASKSDLDFTLEDQSFNEYFIQIQGETSLQILEEALGADLHDIKFAKHRIQEVDGMQVQVIRLGMTGNLAYEIHGPMQDFVTIYDRVWMAGQKYGAQKLGLLTYNLFNHTEAGFPNINLHYPMPWFEGDPGLAQWCAENPMKALFNVMRSLTGSMGDDLDGRFMTPYDTGMGFLVKFNHDFIGREALEKAAKGPHRTPVTLEWDAEDVGKVFAAYVAGGDEPVDFIGSITDADIETFSASGVWTYRADRVLDADGNDAGVSSGRIITTNYNRMISLGFIREDLAAEGNEVTVVWGTPGTKQFNIKARIAQFPYNQDLIRNENKDVEEIPHPTFA